jgi:tRNA threonylcarbamoyl adenosine modification protein YjeE
LDERIFHIDLPDEAATERLAGDLALALKPGDLLALQGPLGAGKSTLARALIRALADDPALDVPSPTFTLAQSYELRLPLSHFDLYRLADPDELAELGLDAALEEGAALVEWPEKAGAALPVGAIWLTIGDGATPTERLITIAARGSAAGRIGRTLAIRGFLAAHGQPDAARRHLLGDASSRAYETIRPAAARSLILMNAPAQPDGPPIRDGLPYSRIAHLAEDVGSFVAIGRWLKSQGFAAPEIHAADLDRGILLIEDLGDGRFLSEHGEPVAERYEAAIDLLAALHRLDVPHVLPVERGVQHPIPPYDRRAMLIEVELLLDWYLDHRRGAGVTLGERSRYVALWTAAIDRLLQGETGLVLRDYHSPNIIWRGDRQGLDRLGIIDFQDAIIGPKAYDVASLVQDARVTVPDDLAERLTARYEAARAGEPGFDAAAFRQATAIAEAQRASKILGIFVRLDRRDGKPGYLRHLPRMEHYLERALAHPALSDLRDFYRELGLMAVEKTGVA